jgi:hypothetical protein
MKGGCEREGLITTVYVYMRARLDDATMTDNREREVLNGNQLYGQ